MMQLRLTISILLCVFVFAGCATEESKWKEAKEKKSILVYREFQKSYPNSIYSDESKKLIESLEWSKALEEKNDSLLQHCVKTYPDNPKLAEGLDIIFKSGSLNNIVKSDSVFLLAGMKNFRIKIEEDYEGFVGIDLPFRRMTKQLLSYANISSIEYDTNEETPVLHIRSKGYALSRRYEAWPVEKSGIYFTGATLTGTISFIHKQKPLLVLPFSFTIKPPKETQSPVYLPKDAPWRTVYFFSFPQTLLRGLIEIYGKEPGRLALKSPDVEYRFIAARAFADLKDRADIPLLLDNIFDMTDMIDLDGDRANVGFQIQLALSKIGNLPVDLLLEALKRKDPPGSINSGRGCIVELLGESKDPKAVGPLIQTLSDKNWLVRRFIAEALVAIGDQRAMEAARGIAANDPAESTRKAAQEALQKKP